MDLILGIALEPEVEEEETLVGELLIIKYGALRLDIPVVDTRYHLVFQA